MPIVPHKYPKATKVSSAPGTVGSSARPRSSTSPLCEEHRTSAKEIQRLPCGKSVVGQASMGPSWIQRESSKYTASSSAVPPPYGLSANPYSLLDITDLVFIDPVSTGFSRPTEGEEKGQFHGYEEDLRSVGQFIHDYVTKYGRWRSPKFLCGESYGGLRSAGLSGHLRERYNMALNGILMVSPALKLDIPMLFNLYTNPREEQEKVSTDSWIIGPALKLVGEFEASTKEHPLIPMGTPDPYVPPK